MAHLLNYSVCYLENLRSPPSSATHFFLKALPVAKKPSVPTPKSLTISLISDISLLTLSYSIKKYIYIGLTAGDTSRAATCNQNNSFFLTLNMQTWKKKVSCRKDYTPIINRLLMMNAVHTVHSTQRVCVLQLHRNSIERKQAICT